MPAAALALALALPQLQAEAPAGPGLILPEGFVAELVVAAPEIRWPSAVHCLDDGSLLVAEDPMDMVGPADQPIDRILRFVFAAEAGEPPYTTTVFAEGLYAVFGIESIGAEVFVVNMPHLTRLVDADGDGVAERRDVLVEGLGPEPPGMEGGFNDHVVSGLGLGLDGWLYVSVGDKGIPLATGADGSTLSLHGGGVVRVRPDGSRLELVATGTRNHLDVVLDERGEMFTYDNSDDGLGWWTRLTHVIEDGYYGYPFDYQQHPERMLPCMSDYGGGAPAGGLCYREAAWPPLYRGSFFWCEWGKGLIRRFDLAPAEASFRVDLEEDFASAAEELEFRPLDLCLSPDGRSMYVADWAHPGWQSDQVSGRVWRIRRADDGQPHGLGLGDPPATADGWLDELGADSLRLRQRAQRSLVAMGTPTIRAELIEVLALNPVERRRRHALWALTQLGGDPAREAIEQALRYPNQDTNIQALRALRRRGRTLPAEVLEMLTGAPAPVRREAATTIGYLGDGAAATRLVRALQREDDPWVRWAIRRGLRRIGVWDERVLSWQNFTSQSQGELLLALREVYDPAAVAALARFATATGEEWLSGWTEVLAPVRASALEVLAAAHRQAEPWDGRWWSTQPARGGPPPKVLEWEGTPLVLAAVRAALSDPSTPVRRAALEAVSATGDRESLPLVRARFELEPELALRRLALEVLGDLGDAEAVELLTRIARDPLAEPEQRDLAVVTAIRIAAPAANTLLLELVREDALPVATLASAIEALASHGTDQAAALLEERLGHPREELRLAALRALVSSRGRAAEPLVLAAFDDRAIVVQREAVRQAGELALEVAFADLLELRADVAVRAEAYRSLARLARPELLEAHPQLLEALLDGLGATETRAASWQALRQLREELRAPLEARHRAGDLREPLLGELRRLYREPRPLLDWRIAGPYPRGSAAPAFDGATFLNALDGAGASVPVSAPDWRAVRAEPLDGFVDLDELLSTASHLEAWAVGSFRLTRPDEVELVLGSDDSLTVWIDGRQVHDFDGARAWAPDQERAALELGAGEHEVVLRIGQGVGDWAFSLALVGGESGALFQDVGLAADALGIEAYQTYALEHAGDFGNGFRLFQNTRRLGCLRCHVITTARGRVGDRVGPDLDGIGDRYGRAEIARSILEPARRIASGYATERVWTHDERQFAGQIVSEDKQRLILVDSSGERHELRIGEIAGRSPMQASVMPEGYQSLMSHQEFTDLVTFLQSLKGGSPHGDGEDGADAGASDDGKRR